MVKVVRARNQIRRQGRAPTQTKKVAPWKKFAGFGVRAVGGALGSLVGMPAEGWAAGGALSRNVLGWGRYRTPGVRGSGAYGMPWTVATNSLTTDGNIPLVNRVSDKGIRIVHKEYLASVVSAIGFQNRVYRINPGLASTFPWLSKIARNFQQWDINGCLITFSSQMTEAVATYSALGSVSIAHNMNAADNPCANQTELEQLKFCTVAKASETVVAPLECARGQSQHNINYVRAGGVPDGASINDYDHGFAMVAVNGCPAADVVLGRLYISYDITLLNPKIIQGGEGESSYTLSGVTTANYFATTANRVQIIDDLGLTFPAEGAPQSSVTFPAGAYGVYLIDYRVFGGDGTMTNSVVFTYTNCAQSTTYKPFNTMTSSESSATPSSSVFQKAGMTSAYNWRSAIVEISDPNVRATVTVTAGNIPTTAYGYLYVRGLSMVPGASPPSYTRFKPRSLLLPDREEAGARCAQICECEPEDERPVPQAAAAAAAETERRDYRFISPPISPFPQNARRA